MLRAVRQARAQRRAVRRQAAGRSPARPAAGVGRGRAALVRGAPARARPGADRGWPGRRAATVGPAWAAGSSAPMRSLGHRTQPGRGGLVRIVVQAAGHERRVGPRSVPVAGGERRQTASPTRWSAIAQAAARSTGVLRLCPVAPGCAIRAAVRRFVPFLEPTFSPEEYHGGLMNPGLPIAAPTLDRRRMPTLTRSSGCSCATWAGPSPTSGSSSQATGSWWRYRAERTATRC